jgi:hypothetical protein
MRTKRLNTTDNASERGDAVRSFWVDADSIYCFAFITIVNDGYVRYCMNKRRENMVMGATLTSPLPPEWAQPIKSAYKFKFKPF